MSNKWQHALRGGNGMLMSCRLFSPRSLPKRWIQTPARRWRAVEPVRMSPMRSLGVGGPCGSAHLADTGMRG